VAAAARKAHVGLRRDELPRRPESRRAALDVAVAAAARRICRCGAALMTRSGAARMYGSSNFPGLPMSGHRCVAAEMDHVDPVVPGDRLDIAEAFDGPIMQTAAGFV